MSSEFAIRATNLGKTYRMYAHPLARLRQMILPGGKKHYQEFHALQDVNFEIRKGETVGIIGKNGSGKSTLLQLICGILKPTTGHVEVNGRVSALLELGAGFHPEFTGRENVYMQGAIQGLGRAEMDARFDDIAAFADIGEFMDRPVKTYSSGMFVRLAFAVATSVKPDILLIDEALSVGDVGFQAKCFRRTRSMTDDGATLIVVTHSINDVMKHCARALLINKGSLEKDGAANIVCGSYLANHEVNSSDIVFSEKSPEIFMTRPWYQKTEHRWGMGGADIIDCDLQLNERPYKAPAVFGAVLSVIVTVLFYKEIEKPVFGIIIRAEDNAVTISTNSNIAFNRPICRSMPSGWRQKVMFEVPLDLSSGNYFISLGIAEEHDMGELIPLDRRYDGVLFSLIGGVVPSKLPIVNFRYLDFLQ